MIKNIKDIKDNYLGNLMMDKGKTKLYHLRGDYKGRYILKEQKDVEVVLDDYKIDIIRRLKEAGVNISDVIGFYNDRGVIYSVIEYIEGESLYYAELGEYRDRVYNTLGKELCKLHRSLNVSDDMMLDLYFKYRSKALDLVKNLDMHYQIFLDCGINEDDLEIAYNCVNNFLKDDIWQYINRDLFGVVHGDIFFGLNVLVNDLRDKVFFIDVDSISYGCVCEDLFQLMYYKKDDDCNIKEIYEGYFDEFLNSGGGEDNIDKIKDLVVLFGFINILENTLNIKTLEQFAHLDIELVEFNRVIKDCKQRL